MDANGEELSYAGNSAAPAPPSRRRADDHPERFMCHYCKRGFENRQALGGHMNLHRRAAGRSTSTRQQQQRPAADGHYHAGSRELPSIGLPAAAYGYYEPSGANLQQPWRSQEGMNTQSLMDYRERDFFSSRMEHCNSSSSSWEIGGGSHEAKENVEEDHEELNLDLTLGRRNN